MNYRYFLALLLISSGHCWASVKSYFNQNEQQTYIDPYRKIERKGDDLERIILDEIRSAKKSIFLAVQELRLPLVAQALIEKFNQGIDVRIVLEHNYNYNALDLPAPPVNEESEATPPSSLNIFIDTNRNGVLEKEELEARDAIYMIQKAKLPLIDDASDGTSGSGLMHHKFMIIDGKKTLVSTANFTLGCIHGDYHRPQSRGNANSLVVVNSVLFSKIFLDEFQQLWGNGRRGNFGHKKTYRGPQRVMVQDTEIIVQFSPTSQRFNWNESVNGLISKQISEARKSVRAALFVFSDQRLANTMQDVQDKGASIGVIVEPGFAWRDYSELLDLAGTRMLGPKCTYEADNNPWSKPADEFGMARPADGDMLHHKFAVIDEQVTVVGSQNWTASANHVNDETLLVIKNRSVSESYSREYRRVKRTAFMGLPRWITAQIEKNERECASNR